MKRSDIAFIVAVLVFVVGAVFIDKRVPLKAAPPIVEGSGRFVSTGWYCPAPGVEGVDAVMSTTNLGDSLVRLRRWSIGEGRTSKVAEADLGPRRRTEVNIRDFGLPEATGLSEAFGAATTSDSVVLGRTAGVASSRCSVQPWDRWYFATGSTGRGQNTYLLVANPFQEEAVIKVRFLTPESDNIPARLKDLVIPPLSQSSVYLSEYFAETASFGLEVAVPRGRVVVSRYLQVATREGVRGISLDAGVREPSQQWYFAGGHVPPDGEEDIVLINPGSKEALVQVFLVTESDQIAQPNLQEVAVPSGRQKVLRMSDYLPRGTAHSTTIVSTNDLPVVAERQTISAVPGGRGIESTFGVVNSATRWALTVGGPVAGANSLSIMNPKGVPAVVRIALMTDEGEFRPPELSNLRIDSGRRLAIDLTPFLLKASATLVAEAVSGEIAVERRLVLGPPYADFADSFGQSFDQS